MRLVGKALAIFACLFGVYVGIQLIGIHIDATVGNFAGAAARCGSGGGCMTAAQSEFSSLFGIPIAVIGFAFYVASLVVGLYSFVAMRPEDNGDAQEDVAAMLFLFFVVAALYSVFLGWVNYTQLESSCRECTKLYVVNALGLVGSFMWLGVSNIKRVPGRLLIHFRRLHLWIFLVAFGVALGGSIWQVDRAKSQAASDMEAKADEPGDADYFTGPRIEDELLVGEGTSSWGDSDADVTIVEFSDFQCPYCARFAESVGELKEEFSSSQLRVVFRNFPLSMHPRARVAAKAAVCAQDSGHFWSFHDTVFANQQSLSDEDLARYGESVGMDPVSLANCIDSDFAEASVSADRKAGEELGIQGTPTIYINGRAYDGPLDTTSLRYVINRILTGAEAEADSAAAAE